MARTPKITDEQILDAARLMFKKHGFNVTTAQIADEAGISEGSIFRHYSSKHELMTCALGIKNANWFECANTLAESGDPLEVQLTTLVTECVDFFVENIAKMMAVVSAGADYRRKLMRSENAPPVMAVRTISNYFERLRVSGAIRNTDPELLARMLLGSCHHYAFSEYAGINSYMPMPRETYIRGIVNNLIHGIGPINE